MTRAPEGAQLTPELLELVQYLREHTFCIYYDAVRAVIPYGARTAPKQGPQGPYLERAAQGADGQLLPALRAGGQADRKAAAGRLAARGRADD